MVPHESVKEFLFNKDINEKRAGWITEVMESDIEIKITKLVRGKGLCEQMVSSFETPKEATLLIHNEQPTENEN